MSVVLRYMYINIKEGKYILYIKLCIYILYYACVEYIFSFIIILYFNHIIFYVDEVYCTHVVIVILFGTFDFKNGYG